MVTRKELKRMITSQSAIAESFLFNMVLSISGGLQDAYTYIGRDKVFANAQTGNVVLFSMNLMERDMTETMRYLIPILAFAAGIFFSDIIRMLCESAIRIHWKQCVLAVETVILFAVAFVPHRYDSVAAALVSFSCALQVQTFRSVSGHTYASTMCIGNIRSGVSFITGYLRSRNRDEIRHASYYFGIIVAFAIGAGAGAEWTKYYGLHTILASCVLLTVGILILAIDGGEEEPA